jgi:energy-coupling factor transport system ATP-binding protein|tara:strand:- start:717 stop:1529 length:813 start_codon:yes stop_codon:yes gene_type:complete
LIEFSDVDFDYPQGQPALRDINLSIKTGELVAILGGNGAGKSTLVRHINGLLKPTRGTVTVFGNNTRKASVAEISRRVGIVFQSPDHQLFAETVEKEIDFALRNFGTSLQFRHERIRDVLDFFDLQKYRSSSPLKLSSGEKKRLSIASIMAWKPDILILDEPTVGQDAFQQDKLKELVGLWTDEGKTVVIVSHDLEFLWGLVPRLIILSDGSLVADGKTEEILMKEELIQGESLHKPQLLDLAVMLRGTPPYHSFQNASDAAKWILKSRE